MTRHQENQLKKSGHLEAITIATGCHKPREKASGIKWLATLALLAAIAISVIAVSRPAISLRPEATAHGDSEKTNNRQGK